ncbi:M48 family metalloprotease [Oceanospirillum sanctuarii]|uniref:M48 family metalloprotease n=1 Tax=Oceanospirillum sanctuarii TaxID=1434821 RepID=UPI000A374824|nr:M48 family metalloprotease [Oceanospirillum sanctuarii]
MKKTLLYTGLVTAMLTGCTTTTDSQIRDTRLRSDQIYTRSTASTEDVEAEIQFGRELSARILARYKLSDDQRLQKYLNIVGKTLGKNSGRPELTYYFAAIESDDINAYAAPGGYVFVTTGAIAQMNDEAELAGVLAHEIAHITEKHIVKAIGIKGSDSSAISGFSKLLGASNDPTRIAFSQAIDKALDYLFENGLQAEDEYQSDATGTLIATQTGYDPDALRRYLSRIKSQRKQLDVVNKTHPPFNKRLFELNQLLTIEGLTPEPDLRFNERFKTTMNKVRG